MSDILRPHGLQQSRLPCPSLSPGACSNSCPLSCSCYLTISSSVTPFSFCHQSFPALGSFSVNQLFASGGLSIWVSISAIKLPMNIKGWFSLGLTGLISLESKGLRVFSNTIRKHQFFGIQPSLYTYVHIVYWYVDGHTAIFRVITNKVLLYRTGNFDQCNMQPDGRGMWGENGYVYIYGWLSLLSTWNYHNIVNWLYSNIK